MGYKKQVSEEHADTCFHTMLYFIKKYLNTKSALQSEERVLFSETRRKEEP